MTRRRRFNRKKPFSRRRRRQRRRKLRTRSMSITTQLATNALDMLHISTTESDIKPFEFIERYQLTRQQALAMPYDQRPTVVFIDNTIDGECYA